jgi:hypothetical protein
VVRPPLSLSPDGFKERKGREAVGARGGGSPWELRSVFYGGWAGEVA